MRLARKYRGIPRIARRDTCLTCLDIRPREDPRIRGESGDQSREASGDGLMVGSLMTARGLTARGMTARGMTDDATTSAGGRRRAGRPDSRAPTATEPRQRQRHPPAMLLRDVLL